MTYEPVNLARRPFANTRPVRRAAVVLWVLGLALLGVAASLYWRSVFGIEGKRAQIAAIDRSLATEQRTLAADEAALAGMDLRRQNLEASFLNARIQERTFPWSGLFEHLSQVLPKKVRLFSLAPQRLEQQLRNGRGRRGASFERDRVRLQMTGAAATDEDLTQLLDRFFASPWFADPALPSERREGGVIVFTMLVTYKPGATGGVMAVPQAAPARAATGRSAARAAARAAVPAATPGPRLADLPRPGGER